MDPQTYICVNLPFVLLGLLMNIFYVFCLVFPPGGDIHIKQPLTTLLALTVFSTSLFQLNLIFYLSLKLMTVSQNLKNAVDICMSYSVRISIPSSLWLNIFYCSQIVPLKKAPLIWLKKHIKAIVFFLLMATKVYFLVYVILDFLLNYNNDPVTNSSEFNNSIGNNSFIPWLPKDTINQVLNILDSLTMVMALLSLSMMLTATGVTGRYLYEHIKKMSNSGVSQLLWNQIRVTITGFIQGFLYLICSAGIFIDMYCRYHKVTLDQEIWMWTLFDLYSLATTINLGVGQSLFRQRIAQLCQRNGQVPSV